jgi:hypothetical protein
MSCLRASKRWCGGLSATLLLVAGLAAPAAAQGSSEPRLAVELLDLNQFSGAVREQAIAINRELFALQNVLPHIDVLAARTPVEDCDYSLADPRLKIQGDDLSLTARYRGPGAVEDEPTAWYWEACSDEEETDGECVKSTPDKRAAIVVADLLNQTLVHWRNGIFRPFVVRSCEQQSLLLVRLTLSPPTVVETYREPASWFDYRPSVLETTSGDPHPESLELVLGRRTKEGEVFVFERRYDPDHRFAALCDTEGHWILEHQYPGSYRYRPPARRPPPGINAAPDAVEDR